VVGKLVCTGSGSAYTSDTGGITTIVVTRLLGAGRVIARVSSVYDVTGGRSSSRAVVVVQLSTLVVVRATDWVVGSVSVVMAGSFLASKSSSTSAQSSISAEVAV